MDPQTGVATFKELATAFGIVPAFLLVFLFGLLLVIWKVGRWYGTNIAMPESKKRIEFIERCEHTLQVVEEHTRTTVSSNDKVLRYLRRLTKSIPTSCKRGIEEGLRDIKFNVDTIEASNVTIKRPGSSSDVHPPGGG